MSSKLDVGYTHRRDKIPYVNTIPYEQSDGELKEAYDMLLKSRGRIPNVQAMSSLKPNIMKTLMVHVG